MPMMGSAYTRVGGEMEDEAQRGRGRRSEEDMVDEKQQNGGSDLKF